MFFKVGLLLSLSCFSAHGFFWGSSNPQDDLRTAIKSNDLEGIRESLEDGVRVNYRYADDDLKRPVHYVQSVEAVDLLADEGATINVQDRYGRTPLNHYLAHADSWDEKVAEALVREGVPVNGSRLLNIPLFDAKSAEQLAFLVNAGVDVNVANMADDRTRLHAVKSVGEARVLVNAGVNINARDRNGETPLHAAVKKDLTEVAEFLVNAGVDVNNEDSLGRAPLFDVKSVEMATILLNGRADPHIEDLVWIGPRLFVSTPVQYNENVETALNLLKRRCRISSCENVSGLLN